MPGAELRGSSFTGGDAVVALGVDLVEADSLQVGDALADVGGSVGVGRFEGIESFVNGGGADSTVELEIGVAPLPLGVVLIEPTIEVSFDLWISSKTNLRVGSMAPRDRWRQVKWG